MTMTTLKSRLIRIAAVAAPLVLALAAAAPRISM
jgi:hypothetical protein